jgi:MFS family permease
MVALSATASGLPEAEHDRQLRRALLASTVGTTIEWYDFLLYGTVTGLVFGKLFFPESTPLIGVLQAFGVFFIGFVGRPIGAAIFGHFGDRIGRKATLIVTLLVTGIATFCVGLVPSYDSIGVWGAVLLTFIRLVQGIGVGEDQQASRLYRILAAIRRPRGPVPGELRSAVLQLAIRGPVPGLGLAHSLLHQHRHGRHRPVDQDGDYGNAGVSEGLGRGACRTSPGA